MEPNRLSSSFKNWEQLWFISDCPKQYTNTSPHRGPALRGHHCCTSRAAGGCRGDMGLPLPAVNGSRGRWGQAQSTESHKSQPYLITVVLEAQAELCLFSRMPGSCRPICRLSFSAMTDRQDKPVASPHPTQEHSTVPELSPAATQGAGNSYLQQYFSPFMMLETLYFGCY